MLTDIQIDNEVGQFPWNCLDRDGTVTTGARQLMEFARVIEQAVRADCIAAFEGIATPGKDCKEWAQGVISGENDE
jgi:hypothetical protein